MTTSFNPTLNLLEKLIRCPSLTPNDAGCQSLIAERLHSMGFTLEHLRFDDVDNLWARKGTDEPLVVFAGHTDVVPTGPLDKWTSPPFEPTIREGFLYGRGAADMKSGLAAMIIAVENFLQKNPTHPGSIGFLITSDEEGPSINGTKKVMETLTARGTVIHYCIIGEATSEQQVGDQIRVGRRGSLSGKLTILGKQGHIAYPHIAINPIHHAFSSLKTLAEYEWDHGNAFFPPTSFQLSNIHAGTGAENVIPGSLDALFNFRYSTAVTADELMRSVHAILDNHHLNYTLKWNLSGLPFLTHQGRLTDAVSVAIKTITGQDTVLSTAGGTSDGRFIAPTGAEVIELGPCNASVHQINEHVRVADLEKLTHIYEKIVEELFF